jgi:hypothetical protein
LYILYRATYEIKILSSLDFRFSAVTVLRVVTPGASIGLNGGEKLLGYSAANLLNYTVNKLTRQYGVLTVLD